MDKISTKITLGFNWNPNMSYEEFCTQNKTIKKEKTWEIFNLIEERYILNEYENK